MKEYTKKQKYFENIQPKDFKRDFSILNNATGNAPELVYLDNAATTQKPNAVIERVKKFYEQENANTHSGIYSLAENAAASLDNSRKEFARFINAGKEEIIFTRNATDSFNMIAEMLSFDITKKDNIVATELEHHSNFVPWQQLAKNSGAEFRVAKYDVLSEEINPESLVDANTKIVAFTLMSNVTGLILDAEKIIAGIKKKNRNALIIVDATQAVAHFKVDVKKINADFLCFSAHKLYGPAGVGVLYGKTDLLEKLAPSRFGGSMIKTVTTQDSTWADIPHRLEPGTTNVESIVGASEALIYLNKNKTTSLFQKEEKLKIYALKELKKISNVEIIGHKKQKHGSVISFTMKGIHPHDVASICARKNVCIRAGHQCAQPLHERLGIPASIRVSLSFYNEEKDINRLIESLKEVNRIFKQ
jgi:cysteine desulfurase/selenocysteine lyase